MALSVVTSWAKLRSLKISFFLFFLFFYHILKSSDFSDLNYISSHNWYFTYQEWYEDFVFPKFIRFPDFIWIFPDFPQILRFKWFELYFFTERIVYLSNVMFFPEPYPVSGFYPNFSGFFRIFVNLKIQVVWIIFFHRMDSLLIKHDVLFRKFIDFHQNDMIVSFSGHLSGFMDFSGFSSNLQISRVSLHFTC